VIESIRLPKAERPYFTPGFPLAVPLQHGTRIESFDKPTKPAWKDDAREVLQSDTGELAWRKGLVTVNAPRSQALIGFVKTNPISTANFSAAIDNAHCAITLNAVDGQPIARSAKLLLTAGSRVENTGMQWNAKRTSLTDWGKAPTRIDVVSGSITLQNLVGAKSVRVTALDMAGKPVGSAPVEAKKTAAGWVFPVGGAATVWYGVEVRR
jgi:hypothetical protein